MNRPERSETGDYYYTYIDQVPDEPILNVLRSQELHFMPFLLKIPEEKGNHRYEEGKWSIKEVIQHINDTERIFCFRGLALSRNEKNPIPGFEQDDYVAAVDLSNRSIQSLAAEFLSIRKASLSFYKSLDDEMSVRSGTASGFPMSVRSTAYIIAGHLAHHQDVLLDRYMDNV